MKKKKFRCKSEAQKAAIRRSYAIKSKTTRTKIAKPRREAREWYVSVMRQDFPNDFLDDDFLDAIEDFARR